MHNPMRAAVHQRRPQLPQSMLQVQLKRPYCPATVRMLLLGLPSVQMLQRTVMQLQTAGICQPIPVTRGSCAVTVLAVDAALWHQGLWHATAPLHWAPPRLPACGGCSLHVFH